MSSHKSLILVLLIVFFVSCGSKVRADLYGFINITNNNAIDAAIGEAQLFVNATSVDPSKVLFTFTNFGPQACSITDVYFDSPDGGALQSLLSIDDSDAGVEFSQNASPPDLPGGNSISPQFQTTPGFSTDSDPPAAGNGVNPGESLGIIFALAPGETFSDVIDELNNGSLRIGIHVQAFESGGSESFVNDPPHVPAPSAALLGMIGLGLVGWMRRPVGT